MGEIWGPYRSMYNEARQEIETQKWEEQKHMADAPKDPITALVGFAAQLHEVYSAFLTAGFDEEDAMELTKTIIRESWSRALEQ